MFMDLFYKFLFKCLENYVILIKETHRNKNIMGHREANT